MTKRQDVCHYTLARKADGSWDRIANNRSLALYRGDALAPHWSGQEVQVMSVQVDHRQIPPALAWLSESVWRFDQDGKIDTEHARELMRKKLSGIKNGGYPPIVLEHDDLVQIHKLVGLAPPDR